MTTTLRRLVRQNEQTARAVCDEDQLAREIDVQAHGAFIELARRVVGLRVPRVVVADEARLRRVGDP